jgi:integrase/recombinase XerD
MDSKQTHKINLTQYRKVGGKWQFVPVKKDANGEPNTAFVIVNGESVSSKGEGTFYLDWREDGKRKRKPCGTNPREAKDAWRQQMGIASGRIEADPETEQETGGTVTIDTAIRNYLRDVKATKKPSTHRAYRTALKWFRARTKKHLVSKVDQTDIMALFAAGRTEGIAQATINKHITVALQALRSAGSTVKLKKGTWPKTEDAKIDIYQPEELRRFFAACDPDEKLLFQVFLHSGFRDKEVAHLEWPDVDFTDGTLSVTSKPGFSPKSYETRSVPVHNDLIDSLKRRMKGSTAKLVFPTPPHPTKKEQTGDKPDGKMLETCKAIAYRAGLNCGRCTGEYTVYVMLKGVSSKAKRKYSCATSPRCGDWFLHKFRHTFATNQLQSSVDIRSLQLLMGHKNLSTTEKYLKSLRLGDLRQKVQSSRLAEFV